jgi:predicted RNA-binding Zn ribbon-like protein
VSHSFHRGSLALDFAGTLGARASDAPEERLPDAAALSGWLAEAGLAEGARPTDAELAQARALRDAIFELGAAQVHGRPLPRRALETLNAAAEGLARGRPSLDARGRERWSTEAPVALALGRVAHDAIRLLSTEPERLTLCELPSCGALLLSRSRSDRRRWCSMELCGNRAKVAAYRARQAQARPRRTAKA